MSFCVQLVTRGNLKRLQRKYEVFVYCVLIWCLFVLFWWLNVKNLKLFPENIWWFGIIVLTLHPETKNELSYERKH